MEKFKNFTGAPHSAHLKLLNRLESFNRKVFSYRALHLLYTIYVYKIR